MESSFSCEECYLQNSSEEMEAPSQIYKYPPSSLGKKRGRPVKKGDKEWEDGEIYTLIDIWAKHECLYNSKHQFYTNKTARAEAIDSIVETLRQENIETTSKQVHEKLTKLRNYYGAERRKEECSKTGGTDPIYISQWRFYTGLYFLEGTLTHRATVSNKDNEYHSEDDIYPVSNSPSAKTPRKYREKSRKEAEHAMDNESTIRRYEERNEINEDSLFTNMVYEMLSKIPDCQEKAMAKLEFQQKLISLKYST